MTKAVNSGMKSAPRVSGSLSESQPTAREKITASMPKNGTAGEAARVPGAPPRGDTRARVLGALGVLRGIAFLHHDHSARHASNEDLHQRHERGKSGWR